MRSPMSMNEAVSPPTYACAPLGPIACGSTEVRNVATRSAVCALSGAVVGITPISATVWFGLSCGGTTDCTPGVFFSAAVMSSSTAWSSGGGQLHDDEQRAVGAGPEAGGDEVVRLPLRGGRGQVAVVGLTEAHRQHRPRDHQQDQHTGDGERPRVPGDQRRPPLPHAARGRRGVFARGHGAVGMADEARDLPTVDAVADHRDDRRQQRERSEHHHRDDDARPCNRDVRRRGCPAMARPQIAMTTVVPANRTAEPAVATERPTAASSSRPVARFSR